jgi:hypothetical protein
MLIFASHGAFGTSFEQRLHLVILFAGDLRSMFAYVGCWIVEPGDFLYRDLTLPINRAITPSLIAISVSVV